MSRAELDPVYTLATARAVGMTRVGLALDGVRVTRGAYVSRSVLLTLRTASLAALQVLPDGAVMSHETAAALLGAPVQQRFPLHVTVPPGAYRPRRARLRTHVRALLPSDRTERWGVPVTSAAQTWLDLVPVLAPAELVAVGDALMRLELLRADTLAERLSRADRIRGVVRARELAPLLSPLAMSRPESLVRYWLTESPLPNPEPQIELADRYGRPVTHADLGYRRWKVAIEYEGRQHADEKQFGRDLTRYSLMAADGWLVLRFGAGDLARPDRVVARVAAALRSRGATW